MSLWGERSDMGSYQGATTATTKSSNVWISLSSESGTFVANAIGNLCQTNFLLSYGVRVCFGVRNVSPNPVSEWYLWHGYKVLFDFFILLLSNIDFIASNTLPYTYTCVNL